MIMIIIIIRSLQWLLQFEWLSLMAVWRLPRLVALLDGIEAEWGKCVGGHAISKCIETSNIPDSP